MDERVKESQEYYDSSVKYWSDIRKKARDDLRFLSDDQYSQWDSRDVQNRIEAGKPVMQVDLLRQFIHQVVNDIKMNTPTINPIPEKGADQETAEIIKELIRDIEYKSRADNAYDMAVDYAIKCSLGYIRVNTDYESAEGDTNYQRLTINRIVNPLSVIMDSESIDPDGSDARRAWITETISVKEFERRYPGRKPVSFGDESCSERGKDDTIDIAEYFYVEEEEVEGEMRSYSRRTVKRCVMSGDAVLEEGTFPGRWIPIVPVYGEEFWADGKREIHSLIRASKPAQQAYNVWKSVEMELLLKQPTAKFQTAEGQVEDFIEDYTNPGKTALFRYRSRDAEGNPVNPPIQLQPPMPPVGIMEASRMAMDDIRGTLGIYGAGVGDRSNETSGIAINSRKLESDVATYHFGDNLIKSITHVGRILLDAIPEVYDQPRIVATVGEEGETKNVGINGMFVEGQQREYDLVNGRYGVRVITGAPFTTKRQEAVTLFEKVLSANPELWSVAGDLFFENSDIAGAKAMAERMKKVIDPKFLEDSEEDPRIAQMMEMIEQQKMQLGQMAAELESKQADQQLEREKIAADLQREQIKREVDIMKLQLEREKIAIERERMLSEQRALSMQPDEIAVNAVI